MCQGTHTDPVAIALQMRHELGIAVTSPGRSTQCDRLWDFSK
ncbi:hypothetical protein [Laspinema sp. D2d]|nr:hypothetical protein [Laspinema sp. D2d]